MEIKINKKTNEITVKCKSKEEMIWVVEAMKSGFEGQVQKSYGEVEIEGD